MSARADARDIAYTSGVAKFNRTMRTGAQKGDGS